MVYGARHNLTFIFNLNTCLMHTKYNRSKIKLNLFVINISWGIHIRCVQYEFTRLSINDFTLKTKEKGSIKSRKMTLKHDDTDQRIAVKSVFRPPFWDLLMLQLLRPNSSNLPCLYSTFHLEYPLVLSRFCFLPLPMYHCRWTICPRGYLSGSNYI